MQTRLATADDQGAIEALIRPSVLELLGEFHSPAVLEAALASSVFGLDTQLIADGTYFVCEDGGRIVGCGGWSKRRREFGGDAVAGDAAAQLLDPATDAARIRAFFVAPDWVRRGVGSSIMDACERAIAASAFQRVEIAATLAGEKLYERFGFRAVDREEHPLGDSMSIAIVRMVRAVER